MAIPDKRSTLLQLLESGQTWIILDPRKTGVIVPPEYKDDPHVVIVLGYDMPKPILDLQIDEWGVTCTLSFDRQPFGCRIPWDSIYQIFTKGFAAVYFHDEPPSIPEKTEIAEKRSHLKLV